MSAAVRLLKSFNTPLMKLARFEAGSIFEDLDCIYDLNYNAKV